MNLMNEAYQLFESKFQDFIASVYDESPLGEVVRYAASGEGKRIRPVLTMLVSEAVGGDFEKALSPAFAVEMIHTYSLVHDDLPCLDNDDFRRGRQTSHKIYGEDRALLAGDALQTDAFLVLSDPGFIPLGISAAHKQMSDRQRSSMVRSLARAAGSQGMVYGQAEDVHWTGKSGYRFEDLNKIHRLKTGALIGAACEMGAIAGGADEAEAEVFFKFGQDLGHAFQICDDLLDGSEGTGKSAGKDFEAGKLTYLAVMDFEEAKRYANDFTNRSIGHLESTGRNCEAICELALGLLKRRK